MKDFRYMSNDKRKILVLSTNLFFLPRVQNVATPNGYDVRQVMTIERLQQELSDGDSKLAFVDLEGESNFWSDAIRQLLDAGESRPMVIGYGGHSNLTILERAKKFGCDLVLTKGQFSRDLHKLIESGGHEIGEAVTDHMV